jgi:MoaA/NifB/PqqE/SkfB family radical SAM enzyme
MNGATLLCCKSPANVGNWQQCSLDEVYNSKAAKNIRLAISKGQFANKACETCYKNGSSLSLGTLLDKPRHEGCEVIRKHTDSDVSVLVKLRRAMRKLEYDDEARAIISEFNKALDEHFRLAREQARKTGDDESHEYLMACRKLAICSDIVERFLSGEVVTKHPAPLRQSNLIAVCNARCIQCPGRFTGEISHGVKLADGTVFTEMPDDMLDKSFDFDESIIDFFVNGSEFLFYKRWRQLAERLKKLGVQARIATNGMLLTPKHTDYLLENKLIGKLMVSLDGATKETLEAIRQRVKYDRVVKNYKYFLKYAAELNYALPVSSGFVLMTDNYMELPQFVELIHRIREGQDLNTPAITISALGLKGGETYREFVKEHHHTNVEHRELAQKFQEMLVKSEEFDIRVSVFHTYALRDFVEQGCPVPALNFMGAKEMKEPVIDEELTSVAYS